VWTIPPENSKNGKAFDIPLAPVVVGWFRELLNLGHESAWVLPGVNRRGPIAEGTLNAALDRLGADVPHFTVHDLRRTARTHLGKLGVDIITAEKCLNHTLGGLVDVYDRGDYFEERRRALGLWADFLTRCEQPSDKVISLRKTG
jgi:integrase